VLDKCVVILGWGFHLDFFILLPLENLKTFGKEFIHAVADFVIKNLCLLEVEFKF
jgi:hypothetical protein